MAEIEKKSKTPSSGRGGARPGAGRPKGTPNRATVDQKARLSELARSHADLAFAALVEVAQTAPSDSVRVSAAIAILDRGFGRPGMIVEQEPVEEDIISRVLREIAERKPFVPG